VPRRVLQTDAFVLLKRPPADAFQSCTVFSPAHGVLFVLQRIPKKGSATAVPLDLFDDVALLLEASSQGQNWFIREVRVQARHAGIGRSYDALKFASALASLIVRNPVAEESRPPVGALLRTALAAFETSSRPDIVFFKSLYCFARDEGYPVKQQWLAALPAAERDRATALLNRPLSTQTSPAAEVGRLQQRLEEYLRGHTEVLLE
jgi:hypothetical protein